MTETITKKNGVVYPLKENKDRFLYPGEFNKMFNFLKKKQQHSVKVQINTGARIFELQNVKVEDCFIEEKRIMLKVTKCKAKKGERKGRPRTIPISSQFAKNLKGFIRKNNLKPEDTLKILSTAALNQGIKKAAKLSGIKDYANLSSHNMRKTLECWLMSLDVKDSTLLAHIGHDMKTAMSAYVSPDVFSHDERREMRRIIGDLYER